METRDNRSGSTEPAPDIDLSPFPWYQAVRSAAGSTRLAVDEWDREDGRKEAGFSGSDFCHSRRSAVRIIEYFLVRGGGPTDSEAPVEPSLVGFVHFSNLAESHR